MVRTKKLVITALNTPEVFYFSSLHRRAATWNLLYSIESTNIQKGTTMVGVLMLKKRGKCV